MRKVASVPAIDTQSFNIIHFVLSLGQSTFTILTVYYDPKKFTILNYRADCTIVSISDIAIRSCSIVSR